MREGWGHILVELKSAVNELIMSRVIITRCGESHEALGQRRSYWRTTENQVTKGRRGLWIRSGAGWSVKQESVS